MLENHCKKCLNENRDCCINGLKKYNLRVFASKEEIKRIGVFKGFEKLKMGNIENSQVREYQKQDYDSVWKNIFTKYDEFYILKYPCIFISPKGCKLSNKKKPFICLIFPADFDLTKKKIIYNQTETDYIPCKAKKAYNFKNYLKKFNITKAFLQKRLNLYYQQLKKEYPKAFK